MTKISIRFLLVAVALFAIGFTYSPGLTILLLSFVPLFLCLILLFRNRIGSAAKMLVIAALLISIFPIYVTSIGPLVWLDSRLEYELNYYHVYAPLEPIAESTGMISPLASYTRLWTNPEPQTLPNEAYVQMQSQATRQ
ncbi:hypothetical protein [Mariniblastus fucicola]|uniref:Uncharacterized protein n=1 Tax=Mariniblastus fucicola TaxID=980251 RepID=A0A5B9P6K5_9BACT|nr:hypothetical protein [Mariniblastus fucicola]QEG22227.1 hypothetical protein MFFC18_21030 [Mariniblastus fucicola]